MGTHRVWTERGRRLSGRQAAGCLPHGALWRVGPGERVGGHGQHAWNQRDTPLGQGGCGPERVRRLGGACEQRRQC